jgi:hypothetical protein
LAGSAVTLSRLGPQGECQEIGPIIGSSGGGAFGSFVANADLAEWALDDLREAAGRAGATHVQHGDIQFGQTDGTTTNAMVSGTAFACGSEEGSYEGESSDHATLDPARYALRGADGTFEEAVRSAVAASGVALLRCLDSPRVPLTLTFDAHGRVESFRAPVPTTDAEECVQTLLDRVRVPNGGSERTITVVIAGEGAVYLPTSELSVQPATAVDGAVSAGTVPAEADVRAALDRNADAILACTSTDVLAVRVERGDEGVTVEVQGGLAGTPEAACVRSVVGELSLPPEQNALIHVVRRQ